MDSSSDIPDAELCGQGGDAAVHAVYAGEALCGLDPLARRAALGDGSGVRDAPPRWTAERTDAYYDVYDGGVYGFGLDAALTDTFMRLNATDDIPAGSFRPLDATDVQWWAERTSGPYLLRQGALSAAYTAVLTIRGQCWTC
eukprot:gene14600-8473_t